MIRCYNFYIQEVGKMKLLKVKARNFKNLANDVEIDFVAKARKTSEDKEYELQEIADDLYVYTTMAFVGKNASGKTTALDLLFLTYNILSYFRVQTTFSVNNVELTIYFYYEGYIYKYDTKLVENAIEQTVSFENEALSRKQYYKSYSNDIYKDDFQVINYENILPEDISVIFNVLKKKSVRVFKFDDRECNSNVYRDVFELMDIFGLDDSVLKKVIKIFDDNIHELRRLDSGNYRIDYDGEEKDLTPKELFNLLSSGTTKGLILYLWIIASLKAGFTIIIDEIENHFHKTLVENIISLYKDKSVNRNSAMLIFSTHYCEILDMFNRQDNIYIAKADRKVYLKSIYESHNVRNDILKSKQFYNNTFKTAVNYEALMDLKKALK